jgi:hypothetical protein
MFRRATYRNKGQCLPLAAILCGLLMLLSGLPAQAQFIHQLSYNGTSWADEEIGGVQVDQFTDITSYITTPNNQAHTFYIGSDNHVHQLFYNGSAWSDEDLTAITRAPNTAFNQTAGFSVGNFQYVYYTDLNYHLHQMLYNNVGWGDTDLTALTGGPDNASDHLVAFTTTPAIHVFYIDIQSAHVHQIFNTNGTNWQDQDLTAITGGTAAAGSGLDGMAGFNIANFDYLYFADGNGHIHQFLYNNFNWTDEDLTALSNTPAIGNERNVAAFVVPGTKKLRVYYQVGTNGHIFQLASTNNVKWTGADLTKKTKGPDPDFQTELAAFVTTPNKQTHVYYVSNGQMNELLLPTPSTKWQNNNVTSESGGGYVNSIYGAAGFSLQGFPFVFYVGN